VDRGRADLRPRSRARVAHDDDGAGRLPVKLEQLGYERLEPEPSHEHVGFDRLHKLDRFDRFDRFDRHDRDDRLNRFVELLVKPQQRDHAAVMTTLAPIAEQRLTFECFGSSCTVIVADAAHPEAARADATAVRARLLEWHTQFSRFRDDSELSRLNADPHPTVPVTPMMRRVVAAAVTAATDTGGLVDPTLVSEIERAGYAGHLDGPGLPLTQTLIDGPLRVPATPHADARWQHVIADRRSGTVTRPPGVRLDPGGIAKGVFADELGGSLASHDAYVVECAGDLRLGGRAGIVRAVHVASPFGHEIIHTFELSAGGVATSGIGKRSWLGPDGSPAHHLLDPGTGRPAFTGVVQATAIAPTATVAEARSKAALLSGPDAAAPWLPDGGVIVLDDGEIRVIE